MQSGWRSIGSSTTGDRASLIAIGTLSLLIQLPFLRRGISILDEGSILAIGEGLAEGEVLYRDRATFIGPLGYEAVGVLIRLFGPHLLPGRIFQLVIFSVCALLVYQILRHFTSTRWAGAGTLCFFSIKALGFPLWTIPNYSQLGMLLSLTAVLAALHFLGDPRRVWLIACGAAVGAVLATKLSLGAAVGAGAAACIVVHSLRGPGWTSILARGAWMLLGCAIPVLLTVIFYAAQGALTDFVDRSLIALLEVSDDYIVAMPGLAPWPTTTAAKIDQAFRYFPSSVGGLLLDGRWKIDSWPLARGLEVGIKAAYYGPILAIAALATAMLRELRSSGDSKTAAGLMVIGAFAAAAYGSTVYRADFAHLMNIAPALLIVSVVALERICRSRWSLTLPVLAAVGWLGAGAAATAAVFIANDTPLETPRGHLMGTPHEAHDIARVLSHLAHQPRDARVMMLSTIPLYYFLDDRPIPGRFDLMLPAYLREGDDEENARLLQGIDQVVYNPHDFPTVKRGLPDFAPRTAETLRDRFRIAKILTPGAFVLAPSPPKRRGCTRTDAAALVPSATGRRVERTSWLMYRVVTTRVEGARPETCFSLPHRVRSGEAVWGQPLLHAATWTPRWRGRAAAEAVFEVRVTAPSGHKTKLFSELRRAGPPGPRVDVSLQAYAGLPVEIEFCAVRAKGARRQQWVRAGWGEPRIVDPSDSCVESGG